MKVDPYCINLFGTRCNECIAGYYVKIDGYCAELPPNCIAANIQTGECLQCTDSYQILAPGAPCSKKVVIDKCTVPDPANPNSCLICEQGYFPSGSICDKVSGLCKDYNPQTGQCTSCFNPNLSLENGKCVDSNCNSPTKDGCTACRQNFIFNSQEKLCKFNDPNCDNIIPIACLQCKSGFYLSQAGNCKVLPPNCQNAFPNGICETCASGFNLSGGNCIQIQMPPNCQRMGPNGNCQACNSGFTLVGNSCMTMPANCQRLGPNGNCQACNSGFTLVGNSCMTMPANCQILGPNGNCQACNSGFSLVGNNCVFLPVNCESVFANGNC